MGAVLWPKEKDIFLAKYVQRWHHHLIAKFDGDLKDMRKEFMLRDFNKEFDSDYDEEQLLQRINYFRRQILSYLKHIGSGDPTTDQENWAAEHVSCLLHYVCPRNKSQQGQEPSQNDVILISDDAEDVIVID